MKKVLSNRQGIKIPHADMVRLRNAGIINLGIENDLSAKIATIKNLGPRKTSAVAAFHFWNWVALGVLGVSIYWSFTKDWWWFIPGLILLAIISSANRKGNAENFLDAAMVDVDFYERILRLDGWLYQIEEENEEKLLVFKQ